MSKLANEHFGVNGRCPAAVCGARLVMTDDITAECPDCDHFEIQQYPPEPKEQALPGFAHDAPEHERAAGEEIARRNAEAFRKLDAAIEPLRREQKP